MDLKNEFKNKLKKRISDYLKKNGFVVENCFYEDSKNFQILVTDLSMQINLMIYCVLLRDCIQISVRLPEIGSAKEGMRLSEALPIYCNIFNEINNWDGYVFD